MPEHVIAPAGKRHGVPDFIYADATARLAATGFLATDVTKFAWQQSDNTIWMLSDESPITWIQVGGTPSGVPGSVIVARLDSDVLNSTSTAAKIAGLDIPLGAGTYVFQYFIRFQQALTSTGVKFSINFTGTHDSFTVVIRYSTPASTSVSDIADQEVGVGGNGTLYQVMAARAVSTTANLGPINGVDTADSDMLWIGEGLLLATGPGNLELYHASELAADSTVKIGTSLIVTQTSE